jgi:hypothetical protein
MITKNQYLEKIAKIVAGKQLVVKAEGDKSGVDLGANPITITISEDTKFVNKQFDTRVSGGQPAIIDAEKIAQELNYNLDAFKLFMQRMVLYHEVGHILYTPSKTKTHPDVAMKMLTNFIEDARIESKLGFHYPPTRPRIKLMNRMMLDNIDLDEGVKACIKNPDKRNIVLLAGAMAGCYYYGLTDSEPSSPAVRRMVEVLDELANNPKSTFDKTTMAYAKEIFELITGLTPEELESELANYRRGGGGGSGNTKYVKDSQLRQEMDDQVHDFTDEIKSYGLEMKNRELRNLVTMKYLNPTLVNHIHQSLKRIIGGKPSKQNVIDFEGISVDIEGFIEFIKNPSREVKMYERAGKKEKPEMYVTLCIDSSGSMGGGQIEVAKKSAINLAYACEKTGIKTCIMDFSTDTKIHKLFDQPLLESEIGELCAGGGTIISCAVKESVKLMSKERIPPTAKCAMIILSDGCDGSAKEVGELLDANSHIHFYMVGIHDNPTQYVVQVRESGGNCYGHVYIVDMNGIMKGLTSFAKDFVKRC